MFSYLFLVVFFIYTNSQLCPSSTITVVANDGLTISCRLNYGQGETSNQCVFISCSSSCSSQDQVHTNELFCRTQCPYNDCIAGKVSDTGESPDATNSAQNHNQSASSVDESERKNNQSLNGDSKTSLIVGIVCGIIGLTVIILGIVYCCKQCRPNPNTIRHQNYEFSQKKKSYKSSMQFKNSTEKLKSNVNCSICLANNCNIELSCSHKYHAKCITSWFIKDKDQICPMCRNASNEHKKINIYCERCQTLVGRQFNLFPQMNYLCQKCLFLIDLPPYSNSQIKYSSVQGVEK